MMIALALIPILAFLFASLITRSYSERYITGVTLLAPRRPELCSEDCVTEELSLCS